STISGATSATLTINPAHMADLGENYNVVVTNSCGIEVRSVNVILTVCLPIGIESFQNQAVAVSVYPNPFSTNVEIRLINPAPLTNPEIVFYNIHGVEFGKALLLNTQT